MSELPLKEAIKILTQEKKKVELKLAKAYDSFCLYPNERDQNDWDRFSALDSAFEMAISALEKLKNSNKEVKKASDADRATDDQIADSDKMIKLKKRTITERLIIANSLIAGAIADSDNKDVPDTNVGDMISRQAAIDAVWNGMCIFYDCDVIRNLKALPSAQPERKTGQWLPDNTNYYDERYICSRCGCNYKVGMYRGKPLWNFCPDCGSYNGGDSDDQQ